MHRVIHLVLVVTAPRGDGLLGSISHSIIARCLEGWPLVPADHPGPREDLCYGPILIPALVRDSFDLVLGYSSDTQVHQQSLKPTDGYRSLDPIGLHLLCITVQHLTLRVT
jgi:hypothetical protein